jgi:SPP1 gp7 family putative phage head morphogenesis protein
MAVNEETIRYSNGLRLTIDEIVDTQTADIARAWGQTWDDLRGDWERSLADLTSGERWPSQTQIRRSRRTLAVLQETEKALNRLTSNGTIRINQDVSRAVDDAERFNRLMMASQYPDSAKRRAGGTAGLSATFNQVDGRALATIVERTTGSVTRLARSISADAYGIILSQLRTGIAIGDNPRTAASKMLSRIQGGFTHGRYRLDNIARTEMLDANRASSMASMRANEDILEGWQWLAELDDRTCPSCWSKHGEVFPMTIPGPDDHQQGRCTSLPATRSWKDLGFEDIDEPESILPNAEDTFNALPDSSKLEIMGPGRLSLLNSGDVSWSDLSTFRLNPDWRGSYVPTPVSALGVG